MNDYAICLFFDAETDELVRQLWGSLAAAGVSSEMPDVGWRPHITLAGCGQLDARRYEAALRNFAAEAPSLLVSLSSVGCFVSQTSIVFLAPTVTQELLGFHLRHQPVVEPYALGLSAYYLPGQWVPHCTLALDLTPEALTKAIEVCQPYRLPIAARLEQIGVVQVKRPQVNPLYAFPLSTKPGQREHRAP